MEQHWFGYVTKSRVLLFFWTCQLRTSLTFSTMTAASALYLANNRQKQQTASFPQEK